MSINTKDVNKFLRDLISTTIVFGVDDEDYVIKTGTTNSIREMITDSNGHSTPILLYKEEIKGQEAQEATILNPLAEGLGQTPGSLWFFKILMISLRSRIETIGITILKAIIQEKKNKTDDPEANYLPIQLSNIASRIVDGVDEKTLDEFSQLFLDKNSEFLSLYYQKVNLRHIVRSGLFESSAAGVVPSWKSKFPKIRKKSWEVFEQILLGVLGIKHKDELSKFDRKANDLSCVRLSSLLNVLLTIYQEINPLLGLTGDDEAVIDLSMLADHINKLPEYSSNARYMVTPQRTVPSSTVVVPGTVPSVPQAMSAYLPQPTEVRLVPGPELADGSQSQPIPVYNQGAMVPGAGISPYVNPWQPQVPVYGYNPQPPIPQQQYYPPNNQPPFYPPYNQIPFGSPNQGLNIIPGLPQGVWR